MKDCVIAACMDVDIIDQHEEVKNNLKKKEQEIEQLNKKQKTA